MSYIGRSAKLSRKTQEKVSFLATAGQTVATGLAYVPTFVEVILNGSTLTDVTDYTATDGNSITFLGDPLTLNDEVTIISLKTFALADHYNKSEADALLAPLASPTLTGTLTADKVVVQDEVEFEGHTGNNALIQKNSGTGRDELQIYSAGDANSAGSRGAGVHLYGNNDNEHAGNVAFITGQNDAGAARMIISGGSANASNPAHRTNTDTRVTIGNNIWNYVDVGDDTALLTLKNPSGVPALYITDASASEGDITVGDGESMQLGHWNGTTFTERMKIDSSGNVLVGKTAVSLGTAGIEIKPSGEVRATSSNALALQLNRLSTEGKIVDFRKDGTAVGSIGVNTTRPYFAGAALGMRIGSSGLLGTNSAGTNSDATVDLGASTVRYKNLYLSGGVYLGGTGSANKLHDYEEGTWTPTVGIGTISHGGGAYTKVGNKVTIKVEIGSFSDKTTATKIAISGLPFASAGAQAAGSLVGRYINVTPDTVWINSSTANFYITSSGNWTAMHHANVINSTSAIYLEATYFTNS